MLDELTFSSYSIFTPLSILINHVRLCGVLNLLTTIDTTMKKDIHPVYNAQTTITCSCGAVFETGATKEDLTIETCSQCHPVYTGKKKIIDSTGRVERFKQMAAKTAEAKKSRTKVKDKEVKKQERAEKQAKAQA